MSGDSGYKADKVSAIHSKMLILLLMLAAGSLWLNYTVGQKQKLMQYVVAEAEAQYARSQRIGFLLTQYQNGDQTALSVFQEEARAAFAKADEVSRWLMSTMPSSVLDSSGATKIDPKGIDGMRQLIQHAFNYATTPDNVDDAEAAKTLAREQVAQYFPQEIGYFVQAKQKEIDMYVNAGFGVTGLMIALILYMAMMLFNPALRYIVRLMEHIEHTAANDTLTGFYNRAMLFKVAATLISGAKRHKHELAILAADIDNFKIINDTYGRAAGDQAIKAVAGKFREVLRTSDVVGRVAGQEFGIFLPSTDEYRAALVAEKLRAAVEEMSFAIKENQIELRVSIGAADMQGHHKNPDDMLRAAELALAKAKEAGRNRVVTLSSVKDAPAPPPKPIEAAPPEVKQA